MKNILLMTIILLASNCSNTMSQKADYYPAKKANVSNEDFDYGIKTLKETYERIERRDAPKNFSDYWNFAVAYTYLKEDSESIREMLFKSHESDPELFAAAASIKGSMVSEWETILTAEEYKQLFDEANELRKKSKHTTSKKKKRQLEIVNDGGYDDHLVQLMHEIKKRDWEYWINADQRSKKYDALNKRNLHLIDSLYRIHNKYIGKSLVGENYASVMCNVIQNSEVESMERYLPAIHTAVQEGELAAAPLCLLLDQMYTLKYNYQIFGTQYADPVIPIGPDKLVNEIVEKYNLTAQKKLLEEEKTKRKKADIPKWGQDRTLIN